MSPSETYGSTWPYLAGWVGHLVRGAASGIEQGDGIALIAELQVAQNGDLQDRARGDRAGQILVAGSSIGQPPAGQVDGVWCGVEQGDHFVAAIGARRVRQRCQDQHIAGGGMPWAG